MTKDAEKAEPSFIRNLAEVAARFVVYQLSMGASALVAQPFISPAMRLSARVGAQGETYKQALAGFRALPMGAVIDMTTAGFIRRVTSAIPISAATMAVGDRLAVPALPQSVISAVIETYLAKGTDPKEAFSLMNKGISDEELAKRAVTAAANRSAALCLLLVRNVIGAGAVFCVDPSAKAIMAEHGESLHKATGLREDDLLTTLKYSLRAGYCAATVPVHNMYNALASGAFSSIPRGMFEPAKLFRGGGARTGALFVASLSIAEGKSVGAGVLAKLEEYNFKEFLRRIDKRAQSDKEAARRVEEEAPGVTKASEALLRILIDLPPVAVYPEGKDVSGASAAGAGMATRAAADAAVQGATATALKPGRGRGELK